jgi:Na+-driven multidrug efflux pump
VVKSTGKIKRRIALSKTKNISNDFTKGSIAKQVLWFSIPFMLSNALQVLYSTIDMAIVGEFVGTPGLSAVSQSSQIINFAVMVCLGFSNAGQVLVAQALGAKKRKEMSEIIGTLFCFVTLVALIFTAIMLIVAHPVLTAMKIPTESYDMAYDYIIISAIGLFFTAGYNMVSAVLRGMGDGKRPLLFIGIASAVNLVLDLIFVGPLNMSVAGAAWATIIGQAVTFIFSLLAAPALVVIIITPLAAREP